MKNDERLRDRAAADDRLPAAERLQRLRVRVRRVEREEAYWPLADAVESLLKAADTLLPVSDGSVEAMEALESVLEALASLLDGIG